MRRWFGLVLAVLLITVSAYGQTFRGAINGTVTDPSGAVVAGASVKATNDSTAAVHEATTT
ncbi:MAG TPA: carboxypeptidase-like regulatory domain-containing protein, partial [Candidatus Binatus sp.]|nr:carboxypeptidase-like regulatory domain-containing protein [Candidatus Binatus sp.]